MKNIHRIWVVLILFGAVATTLVFKHLKTVPAEAPGPSSEQGAAAGRQPVKIEMRPRLVDLGAGECIPCKKMAPILEELKKEFADTFEVEFIDVWKHPEAGAPYAVRMIPTQIFFDAQGRELYRHEGFFGKEDILGTWEKYGVAVSVPPVK